MEITPILYEIIMKTMPPYEDEFTLMICFGSEVLRQIDLKASLN